jgi:hypothetical protein
MKLGTTAIMARIIVRQSILPRAASWSRYAQRGGHVAFVLQWLVGLERLGHDVLLVNTISAMESAEQARAVQSFVNICDMMWHLDRSALLDTSSHRVVAGMSYSDLQSFADSSAALITVALAAECEPPPPLERVRPRIFVDQDPGYTQLWAQICGAAPIIGQHDIYFTIGANVGTRRSSLPTCGLPWRHTWNPILMDWWPVNTEIRRDRFTTIADWWGQPYLNFEGQVLGPKREEFLKFLTIPHKSGEVLELALDIPVGDADIDLLHAHGWQVTSPEEVESVSGYRDWVTGSLGEFSCAKGVYVGTRSGWFSDRSAAYLAAGRPVIVQETGFSDIIPTGEGLFAFRSIEEAVDAIRRVRREYGHHSIIARKLAESYFDSQVVLSELLRQASIRP